MKTPLATIELRGDRMFMRQAFKGNVIEVDVTGVWHFFKEVQAYIDEPAFGEIDKSPADQRGSE